MNTSAKSNLSYISDRKQHHIDICRSSSKVEIESRISSGFEKIRFFHHALPEVAESQIQTDCSFLGKKLPFPLFISCMTGGSPEGKTANKELAIAAQKLSLPFGLGSLRVLFENEERFSDFQMKKWAPDVPILANLGAVQLRDFSIEKIKRIIQKIEADALVIHLNCGQELFQTNGDRDFTGLLDSIGRLIEHVHPYPVIVKETGFGFRPSSVKALLNLGVSYVDIAGAGGTNWAMVEEGSNGNSNDIVREFSDWGIPTAPLLASLQKHQGKILASGGIRSGMDLVKSVALGAVAGGMALPFIRAALDGGAEAVCYKINQIKKTFHTVMILTGSKNIEELRNQPLYFEYEFQHFVETLKGIV